MGAKTETNVGVRIRYNQVSNVSIVEIEQDRVKRLASISTGYGIASSNFDSRTTRIEAC